jgi:site-specific DNA-methyltransferase (adenine-specific)/site-specific DNA-methyltransferase (cytosine-N4-specific)
MGTDYELTPTGLVVRNCWTPELWEAAGHEIARYQKGLMWLIGDWLNAGDREGYVERGKLAEACERFGIAYDTALQASRVSAAFPKSCMRIQNLTFNHHQLVANHAQSGELLQWAADTGATVRQLREEKQRRSIAAAPATAEASGTKGDVSWDFKVGDCRSLPYPDDHFDLVFCSPPYESQRSYGELEFNLSGEEWVAWATDCYMECLRVCKGLVAWVVEGYTDDFAYSSTPFLLHADLHRRGVNMRKVVVYQRNGIPGTGGPDWLRNDWEPIICATKRGRLPWADNTAMGQPPKQNVPRAATNRHKDGSRKSGIYIDPEVCNPGNIISGLVGSGGMGWKDATKNEAPFPEWLAEFFVRSFCPEGGTVLDPFSGSGTTVSVAVRNGRNGVGIDARKSQVSLGQTRLRGLTVAESNQVIPLPYMESGRMPVVEVANGR